MTLRAVMTSIVALGLVMVGGRAALAKPLVAVLGLEDVDKSPDQASTTFAHDFSIALRDRASAGGPYTLQVNADKELVDEKLIKNCDSEAPTCMAPIGIDLGAAYLIWGSIEKKPSGYSVKLLMLNVATRKIEKTWLPPVLPFSDANAKDSQPFKDFARKGYNFLTGTNSAPLRISVTNGNVDRGSVLIDGEERGALVQGSASIAGVAEGKHRIAIEVGGFQRYEASVTVSADEPLPPITLVPLADDRDRVLETHPKPCSGSSVECSGSVSQSSSNTLWKTTAVTGFVVAAVAGGIWGYEWSQNIHPYSEPSTGLVDSKGMAITESFTKTDGTKGTQTKSFSSPDCGDVDNYNVSVRKSNQSFDKACSGFAATKYLIPITVGGALIGAVGVIMAMHHGDDNEKPPSGAVGHRQHKSNIVVTPVISPTGGGATMQFDW